jgi:hypothetical protein
MHIFKGKVSPISEGGFFPMKINRPPPPDYGIFVRFSEDKSNQSLVFFITRFRQTSDGDVIPGPEQGFDIVCGYFSAVLKSFLSHSLNMHFPFTRSSMAFL